jgi:large subunit ribosomal protein L35
MPKLKTRKAIAKRFKVTGSGKLMHRKGGKRHLLTNKSGKRKRQLRKEKTVTATAILKALRRGLPYA